MNSPLINKLERVIDALSSGHKPSSNHLETLEKALDKILSSHLKSVEVKSVKQAPQQPIHIWSDGACSGNPGPGGWGTIVEINEDRFEYSGGSRRTTNNIMELTGALEGIKNTPEGSSIVLTSDSQYVVKGMTEWINGWIKKGWKKADGKDVLNKDLWTELLNESRKRSVRWSWIKGHAGHPENERCDELAREAIKR